MAELNIEVSKLKLNDGVEIPLLGFGTGTAMYKRGADADKLDRERVEQIKTAIKVGYRHLDGAEMYNTEPELGLAIKESKVPRDQLFITTKLNDKVDDVQGSLDTSLKKLGLDYVDLYLIHQPFFAKSDEDLQRVWAELEKIKASGKARSIGVSNFRKAQIEAILKTAKVIPSINQTEYHPYLQREGLKEYLESKTIALAAYGPLIPARPRGQPGPLDAMLSSLARKYAVNDTEILLNWAIRRDVVAITTSSREQHLSDMLRTFTFTMTPRELEDLTEKSLEKKFRAYWTARYAEDDFE